MRMCLPYFPGRGERTDATSRLAWIIYRIRGHPELQCDTYLCKRKLNKQTKKELGVKTVPVLYREAKNNHYRFARDFHVKKVFIEHLLQAGRNFSGIAITALYCGGETERNNATMV